MLVDRKRTLERIAALSRFGAADDGGVDRPALGGADIDARRFLIGEAQDRGYEVWTDRIANVYVRRAGSSSLPPVMTGSHIDSQPTGGRLDGAYGVCAAMETLAALDDAEVKTLRSVVAVIWTNEEGSRFTPGSMGSACFAHPETVDDILKLTDKDGLMVRDEASRVIGAQGVEVRSRSALPEVGCFVELHIEQGPELDEARRALSVVDGIVGVRWYSVTVEGRPDHAGAASLDRRADALLAAATIIRDVAEYAETRADRFRATVGSITVEPNVPNTVAGQAVLTVDARSLKEEELSEFEMWLSSRAILNGCRVRVDRVMHKVVTRFNGDLVGVITDVLRDDLEKPMALWSWAFHDAMYLAEVCPTSMLFVPSVGGISHSPLEHTSDDDLVLGTEALAVTVRELAGREVLPGR